MKCKNTLRKIYISIQIYIYKRFGVVSLKFDIYSERNTVCDHFSSSLFRKLLKSHLYYTETHHICRRQELTSWIIEWSNLRAISQSCKEWRVLFTAQSNLFSAMTICVYKYSSASLMNLVQFVKLYGVRCLLALKCPLLIKYQAILSTSYLPQEGINQLDCKMNQMILPIRPISQSFTYAMTISLISIQMV